MKKTPRGQVYILSAPSGAGKTSLVAQLLKRVDRLEVSVSHTTRPPRPGEEPGIHYHFVSHDTFQQLAKADAFFESAQVFGNHYGTSVQSVDSRLAAGQDVILEIDWQGARQVRHKMPEALSIFILPPSQAALDQRLRLRGQDDEAVIAQRMQEALSEMSHYAEYDYLVINDDFETALKALEAIFISNRLLLAKQQEAQAPLLEALTHGA